jgi:hypothetical protein
MPEITPTKHGDRKTVIADISGAEAIKTWDSSHPWVPQKITVVYRRVDDEPWEVFNIALSGPRLLKSGSLSLVLVNANITRREGPAWAWEWADANLPTSVTS